MFQAKPAHIWRASDRCQHIIVTFRTFAAVGPEPAQDEFAAVAFHAEHPGIQTQIQFAAEDFTEAFNTAGSLNCTRFLLRPNNAIRTPRRCSACPSSKPIGPVPITATDCGKSVLSKTMPRSESSRFGRDSVAMTKAGMAAQPVGLWHAINLQDDWL
jgi:hypothetical protein